MWHFERFLGVFMGKMSSFQDLAGLNAEERALGSAREPKVETWHFEWFLDFSWRNVDFIKIWRRWTRKRRPWGQVVTRDIQKHTILAQKCRFLGVSAPDTDPKVVCHYCNEATPLGSKPWGQLVS